MDLQTRPTFSPELESRSQLLDGFQNVRKTTELICAPLETEDYVVQPSMDVSPPKWHLGHTTWFFERQVLLKFGLQDKAFRDDFEYDFNSYYETFGNRIERTARGHYSRPTVREIYAYRNYVNETLCHWIKNTSEENLGKASAMIELGLQHEQQHQELLLMDIKAIFAQQKSDDRLRREPPVALTALRFEAIPGGLYEIGAATDQFSFDHECPRHLEYLPDFRIGTRLITNAEYLEFIEDHGYDNPLLWLSDGWRWRQENQISAPLYWTNRDGQWLNRTLFSQQELQYNEPVCHISYFEADAFARWAGKRLPSEFEWEAAAQRLMDKDHPANFLESRNYHPRPADSRHHSQFLGDTWEWTASAFSPYPGYREPKQELFEYNAKFMVNQMVLRGGSCMTPQSHVRLSYRNFFQPEKRWQFSGLRLAE